MGCVEYTYTRRIYSKYSRGFGSLSFSQDHYSVCFSLHGNTAAVYGTVYVAISRAVKKVNVIFLAVVYLGFASLSAKVFSLP